MKTLEMARATAPLSEYAKHIDEGPLVLTRKGKPVAALMSLEGSDMESVSLSMNPKFIALIEEARAQHRAGLGVTSDEIRREFGLKKRPAARRK
jgi:PHD/YefM family antitoxin component YafN of YafNO toxin-antitoxin module